MADNTVPQNDQLKEKDKLIEKLKEKINRNNALQESLVKISQLRTNSISELLEVALNQCLVLTNSKCGYLKLYNQRLDQFQKLYETQFHSLNNTDFEEISYEPHLSGYWEQVVATKEPIIQNKLESPLTITFHNTHSTIVVNSFLTLPVIAEGNISAIVEVASIDSSFTTEDIEQLTVFVSSVVRTSERIELIQNFEKAKEKAENSERLKSAFLQNISHEIRTPMNAIAGFSNLLMTRELPEEKKQKFLSTIADSSNQLLAIVTDILTISFIDSKQESLDLNPVNINELIQNVVNSQIRKNKNELVTVKITKGLIKEQSEVLTDKVKLTQILNNLLANALKFTSKGEVNISCIVKIHEIEFTVKDTGIGVPENQFEKIFDRFYQIDYAENKMYGGTGLGLSICKEFVQILQGRIWLESEKGKGSAFKFYIPFLPLENEQKKIGLNDTNKKVLTILVAEDVDTGIELIKELLESLNCRTIIAENGKIAIDKITQHPEIDLVLMDIKMPVMEGHIAARKIRSLNPNIPIIAQTAYALPSEIKRYGSLFDDYITKPIEWEALTEVIDKYLVNSTRQ